ncbi:MAG: TIR domain-containing protein [Desulfuromonadales bacterium]|nr:MAG: TIR domain-containing protein [Desulfuromonadales bacterium]
MDRPYFISYSAVEARPFANQLCTELESGAPPFRVWFDRRDLRPGDDWDRQVADAISGCAGLLFVMTPDSVDDLSVCKPEWARALKCKKPIIPLLLRKEAELPFLIANRQFVDFSGVFADGLKRLRDHLVWLGSPEGVLHGLKVRMADAQRDLRRAVDAADQARIGGEIEELKRQIAAQERIVADPEESARRVEESIRLGLERERQPAHTPAKRAGGRFINAPPAVAPSYFQDRYVETGLVADFLADDGRRLVTVVGRAGVGKTAMACRILKALEGGQLPDDRGAMTVDGIVYLSAAGARRLTLTTLFTDLAKLLPPDTSRTLEPIGKDPLISTEARMRALLEAFPGGRTVVLLDNFEDAIDPATESIRDKELDEALRTLLRTSHHGVKVIITTRVAPRPLALVEPGRQMRVELDQGLQSPFAENILRAMDADGTVGLRDAPDALLAEARQRTLGFPRALEALYAILSADRYTTLNELLGDARAPLPENVVEVLVGEAFSRLDPLAEKVLQALSVYGRPVTPVAVDFLLQPHLPGIDAAPVMNRLVTMHFARKDAGHYYLHPVDRAYALATVPAGAQGLTAADEPPPFSRPALFGRGADFFSLTRTPRDERRTIDDLAPQLAEFDLRYAAGDLDTAASVLLEIDFEYLMLWGYYRLVAQMHEQLRGKLEDPWLRQNSCGNLGTAYYWTGRYAKAIESYGEALEAARASGDSWGQSAWTGSLANCYGELGETRRALELYDEALALARQVGSPLAEAPHINNRGYYLVDLGATQEALECHRLAFELSNQGGDRQGNSIHLANQGARLNDLGKSEEALARCRESLAIAREIGYRYSEAVSLTYLGDIHRDRGEWSEAIASYEEALVIADDISNTQFRTLVEWGLAYVYLCTGDLAEAARFAAEARIHEVPRTSHGAWAMAGVIALRRGDTKTAREAFVTAVTAADLLLSRNDRNAPALDSRGLALCGLVLCDGDRTRLTDAAAAYRAARAICHDAGIVARILQLFDELAVADTVGMLRDLRPLAAGTH